LQIGHLEACAGLAAIVKSVLILESGLIPPTIHYKKGNSKIKFNEWRLKVPTTLMRWPTDGVRRISTNSFGYGGTNAHAVIDDAYHYLKSRGLQGNHHTHVIPQIGKYFSETPPKLTNRLSNGVSKESLNQDRSRNRLFVISAQEKDGLKRVRESLTEFINEKSAEIEHHGGNEHTYLKDLGHTLGQRRSHHQWRSFAIAKSLRELSQSFKDEEQSAPVYRATKQPRIGFVFTGQGAQWAKMGIELMEFPIFLRAIEAADEYLRSQCGCSWSAKAELEKGRSTSNLHLAEYSQTLCTVLQVALVDLLKSWKISPVAVAGHSSGEIAAAYCLGALSREVAWKVAYWRGKLSSGMKATAPELDGSMLAVGASAEQAQIYISRITKGEIVVACINSPSSVTISGDRTGIDELLDILKAEGIFARKLLVDTAYHSNHMQMVAQEYFEAIADIETNPALKSCRMYSSVTGHLIEPSQLGAANWVRNLTSPVQFASAIHDMVRPTVDGKRLEENSIDLLVEIGPHSALQGPATQTLKAYGVTNIPYTSAIVRNQDASTSALELAGSLFSQGFHVKIAAVNADVDTKKNSLPRPLVDLPLYPWNHSQKYWTESRVVKEFRSRKWPRLSLLGAPSSSLAKDEYIWRKFIKLSEEPWISDHQIQGSIIYPGAGYLAMAIEAAYQIADSSQRIASFRLRDVSFTAAVVLSDEVDVESIVQLRPHISGTREISSTWTEFVVTTSSGGEPLQRNCSGLLLIEYELPEGSMATSEGDLESATAREQYYLAAQACKNNISPKQFYKDLTSMGLMYGPTFAKVTEIHSTAGQCVGAVEIPATSMVLVDELQARPHVIHPGTLDAIFHLAFAAANGGKEPLSQPMVPKMINEVVVSSNIAFQPGSRLSGFSNAKKHGFRDLEADIHMFEEGTTGPVVQISGFTCTEVGGNSNSTEDNNARKICSRLTWKPAFKLLSNEEKRRLIEQDNTYEMDDNVQSMIRKGHQETLKAEGTKAILGKLSEVFSIATQERLP
jgi:acyl transferase domain-containing protein